MKPNSPATTLMPFMLACVCVLSACESRTIQNLGDIEAQANLAFDGLEVRVFLLTETGDPLYWETSIVGPVADILPVEELETHVSIWSLQNGQRHNEVYAGRLPSLRWLAGAPYGHRMLIGRLPSHAYQFDTEADSPFGELDFTLTTPKQGDFQATVFNVQIFSASYF